MPGPTGTVQSFEEVRLDEKINFGFSGGPEFFTSIAQTQGGFEQRNINRQFPLHSYRTIHDFFTQEEFDDLKSFFMARRGQAVGFRFMDPGDFASDNSGFKNNTDGTLDTLVASGLMVPQLLQRVTDEAIGIGDGSETQYQLIKTYLASPRTGVMDHTGNPTLTFDNAGSTVTRSTGSWITDGFNEGDTVCFGGTANNDTTFVIQALTATIMTTTVAPTDEGPIPDVSVLGNESGGIDLIRTITKPVRRADGVLAVRPFVDGTEYTEGVGATGFSIDTTTGIVTFNSPPGAGLVVEADFLFDVPVRFGSDLFDATFEEFQSGNWGNLDLIELRLA